MKETRNSSIVKTIDSSSKIPIKKEANLENNKIKVDLVDVVLQALSNNYKLKAAREKVIQAKKDIDIAYADYKPSVDATYTMGVKRREPGILLEDSTLSKSADFTDQNYALTLQQNIYAGGQTSANVNKMRKIYLIAKNDYKGLLENESMKAINAYFDIVFKREALHISKQNIEKLKNILDITQSKYDSGALSIGELSSVKASISNSMAQFNRIESDYNNALEYYNYIVGSSFNSTFPYEKNISTVVDSFDIVQDKAFQKNNKLLSYKYQIASLKNELKIKASEFSPKVDLLLSAEQKEDEEFDRFDGNRYTARINLSYNIYNGGRNTTEYLKTYSSILQSDYEREAQVREMIWNLEKLYNSLISLKESIVNIESELESSKAMVDSYWEGFRHGEQDLYTLLQAQKQLQSAKLDLINSQQNNIIDYFKVLQISGELLKYFNINPNESTFLDLSKSHYNNAERNSSTEGPIEKELSYIPTMKEDILDNESNITQSDDFVVTENSVNENSEPLKDLLSFGELFLLEDSNKFTLTIEDFENIYDALKFIDLADIESRSFIFKKLKNEKIVINIAYSIFDSYEDANNSKMLEEFNTLSKSRIHTKKLKDVQDSVLQFNSLNLVEKSVSRKMSNQNKTIKKIFKTNPSFKDKFLNAPDNYYTINVATFKTFDDVEKIINNGNYYENSFVFTYGEGTPLVKFMYGVYENYQDALSDLNNHKSLQEYTPVIEKIEVKQKLYKRFNKL